jgi:2-keto-3-deoxy-L-rhamnonate aldolase RhmA
MVHVIKTANQETVLVLQLESAEAYENIDEIARVPGVDVVLVGPTDLAASLGFIGESGGREVERIIADVPRRLEGTGVVAGIALAGLDLADIQQKIRWNYRVVSVGNALGFGLSILERNLELLRADATGEDGNT